MDGDEVEFITQEPVVVEDSDEEAWEQSCDDKLFNYDDTEEGKISINKAESFQPAKMSNAGKLNLTKDLSGPIKEQARKDDARRLRHKEKSSRATSEQVENSFDYNLISSRSLILEQE